MNPSRSFSAVSFAETINYFSFSNSATSIGFLILLNVLVLILSRIVLLFSVLLLVLSQKRVSVSENKPQLLQAVIKS